jgi:uncharacterized membrane protein
LTVALGGDIRGAMEQEPLGQELGDQDRLLLVFGYLGPLALVALTASRREFVKWHAKQGIVMWASLGVVYLLLRFVHFLIAVARLPAAFGELFWFAIWLAVAGVAIAALFCLIRALEGERCKLPLLGDLADRL